MYNKKNTDFGGDAGDVFYFTKSNEAKIKKSTKVKKMTIAAVLCGALLCGVSAYHIASTVTNHINESNSIDTSNINTQNSSNATSESGNSDVLPRGKKITNFYEAVANITASSQHEDEVSGDITYHYYPQNMIDNDLQTCWCEGVADSNGIGETITIEFNDTYSISEISIWNGLCKSEELFYKNSRLAQATIEFSDGTYTAVNFSDDFGSSKKVLNLKAPVDTSYIAIRINSVYEGEAFTDTCITEISVQ